MKKFLSILLCITAVMALLPTAVNADVAEVKTVFADITFENIPQEVTELNSSAGYNTYNYAGTTAVYPMYYDNAFNVKREQDNTYIESSGRDCTLRLFNTGSDAFPENTASLAFSFKIKADFTENQNIYSLAGDKLFSSHWDNTASGAFLSLQGDANGILHVYGLGRKDVFQLSGDEVKDWITVNVKYTWTDDVDMKNNVRMDYLYVNDYDVNIAGCSVTATKELAGSHFKKIGFFKFLRSSGTNEKTVAFDDIKIYEPENEVAAFSPANDETAFATDEVSVSFSAEPTEADVASIVLSAYNGSEFVPVENASFIKDETNVLKAVYRGNLRAGSVYKVSCRGKSSVFRTFASYMPMAKSRFLNVNFESEGSASYIYSEGIAENSAGISDVPKEENAANTAYTQLTGQKPYYTLFSSAQYKDLYDADPKSMIISFRYKDPALEHSGGGEAIVMCGYQSGTAYDKPYYTYTGNVYLGILPNKKRAVIFGNEYAPKATDPEIPKYEYGGWHQVDMQLSKAGMTWLAVDNSIIATDVKFPADVYPDGLTTLGQLGALRLHMNFSNATEEDRSAIDNIVVYIPEETEVPKVVQTPSVDNNYSITADKPLYTNGTITMTGNGYEGLEILGTVSEDRLTVTPIIPEGILDGTGYQLTFNGFKDMYGNTLSDCIADIGGDIVVGESSVKKDGVELVPVVGNESSYTVNGAVKIYNRSDAPVILHYIIAQYDADRCVSIGMDTKEIPAQGSSGLSADLELKNIDRNTSVKTFVWKANTYSPLMDAKVYSFRGGDVKATLHLVSDSIGVTYSDAMYPQTGIGNKIESIFNDNLTLKNYSVGGSTTQDYIDNPVSENSWQSNSWEYVKQNISPGDYVMIILGINDSGANVTPEQYMNNMSTMITQAKELGAEVIVGTASFTGWGVSDISFTANKNNYSDYAKLIASAQGVTVLDIYSAMKSDLVTIASQNENDYMKGMDAYYLTENFFAQEEAAGNTSYKNGTVENYGYDLTHLSYKGAERLVRLIGDLLSKSNSGLQSYLK